MKKKIFSLRTAVLVPFILVVTLILLIFMVLWSSDYNFLITEQGTKILSALSANTNQELNALLSEPLRVNELYATTIMNNKLYEANAISELRIQTAEYLKKLTPQLPQIGIMCYGGEQGDFVGIRPNKDKTSYSLMLHDSNTNGAMNIYADEDPSSKLIASLPNYDPRVRPWYAPVKANPIPMWSEIYINFDEVNEAIISSLIPIFDVNRNFRGVSDIDVNLNGLNTYLKSNKAKGNGVIYIVDSKWRVIAHSGTEESIKVLPNSLTAQLVYAVESANPLIRSSSKYLIEKKIELDKITRMKINGNNELTLVSKMPQPKDLDWRVVVIVPENDLMGMVKTRQTIILFITLLIGISGALVGLFSLEKVISPILKSADASKELAAGNWDVCIEEDATNIYETNLLVQGFNSMAKKIRQSFSELLDAQSEIERLHLAEKTTLEVLVNEKTDELRLAMKELSEKEKLASLGGLVTGIAHEINTPLGVAVSAGSLLETLLTDSKDKISTGNMTKSDFVSNMESMEESVVIINSNLIRAATLVKSFKQIAVNQSIEEKSKFNMKEYVDAILISLKHVLKHKNHKILVNCDSSLEIVSYPGSFSQILTNLIMNSLTHGFGESENGEIKIDIAEKKHNLILLYTDNGKGIPPEALPKVFDPFFTTNRSKGGSGLGLNIVYNIVASQLNGKISCTSELGKETTFKIEIPL